MSVSRVGGAPAETGVGAFACAVCREGGSRSALPGHTVRAGLPATCFLRRVREAAAHSGPAFPGLIRTAWRLLQVGRTWGGGCWGCFVTEETSFLQPFYKACCEHRHDPRPWLASVAPAICPSKAGTPAGAPYGSCSLVVQSPGPTRVS